MVQRSGFLLVIALCIFDTTQGQDDLYINRTLQDFASGMRFVGTEAGRKVRSDIEGSEYLNENFLDGEILTMNSEHFKDIPMRYNAFLDNVEVRLPNGTICNLIDPDKIFQILLNKQVLVYTDYVSPEGKKSGFLFVLYDGASKLYRRYYKIFNEGRATNGITPEIPPKIADKPMEYYIKAKDGAIHICNSKKDLLSVMNNGTSEIENYLKKEKIRLNREDDLIKVVSYYDSLP